MTREDYLQIRQKIVEGHIDHELMELFYNFWLKFKKEEYYDIDFERFHETFSTYLSMGFNYNNVLQKVINYYDQEFAVQTVKDKQGNVLAIR